MTGLAGVLGQVSKDVKPRMLASLTIADVVERAIPLLEGESDVATFLKGLQKDTNFNVIGNFPIARLLGALGGSASQDGQVASELPMTTAG